MVDVMTSTDHPSTDFLIVGAGMAGASAAYFLAPHGRVTVIEAEAMPGYHTTGRSAAFFAESYGGPRIQPLTTGSKQFFFNPPAGFSDLPLVSGRGALHIARQEQLDTLERFLETLQPLVPTLRRVDGDQAVASVPVLREGSVAAAIHDPDCRDLDVAAIHQGFLRGMKAAGGRLVTDARLTGLERHGGRWIVETTQGRFAAETIVNCGGAWGDEVARLAGARPLGLTPLRRTIILFPWSQGEVPDDWPLVLDVDEAFYFKPETGRVLASPADETQMPACDVQPDEMDVAITVDRLERATHLTVGRIESKWAGLRTFAPDRVPVVGFDPDVPGFFWCVGQGGYGIQTAPAMGRLTAALATGTDVPADLVAQGVRPRSYSPARFLASA